MLVCAYERGAAARAGESETGAGVFAALERFGEEAGLARSLEIAADLGVLTCRAAGRRDATRARCRPRAQQRVQAQGKGPWGRAALPARVRACLCQRSCQASTLAALTIETLIYATRRALEEPVPVSMTGCGYMGQLAST